MVIQYGIHNSYWTEFVVLTIC